MNQKATNQSYNTNNKKQTRLINLRKNTSSRRHVVNKANLKLTHQWPTKQHLTWRKPSWWLHLIAENQVAVLDQSVKVRCIGVLPMRSSALVQLPSLRRPHRLVVQQILKLPTGKGLVEWSVQFRILQVDLGKIWAHLLPGPLWRRDVLVHSQIYPMFIGQAELSFLSPLQVWIEFILQDKVSLFRQLLVKPPKLEPRVTNGSLEPFAESGERRNFC